MLLAVDDSHATGVLGKTGRGTAEEQGVFDRIPVTTGHARQGDGLGGRRLRDGPEGARRDCSASAAARTSSPTRFRPPSRPARSRRSGCCARTRRPVAKLRDNAAYFRKAISDAGFQIPHGTHPIVPVIVGDTAKALAMGKALFEEGVYVSGFGFPVVPQGQARLRCQVSAAHERADLDRPSRRSARSGRSSR